jgi:isocitrate/isopropylmalate dehydrogenase
MTVTKLPTTVLTRRIFDVCVAPNLYGDIISYVSPAAT